MKKNIALLLSIVTLILLLFFLRINTTREYNGLRGKQIDEAVYGYDLKTYGLSVNGLTIKNKELYYLLMEVIDEEQGIYQYQLKKLNVEANKITDVYETDNINSYCSIKESNIYCYTSMTFQVYDLDFNEIFNYIFTEESLTANYVPYKDIYIKINNKEIYLLRNNQEEIYRTIKFDGTLLYETYYITNDNTYILFLDEEGSYYLYDINENELGIIGQKNYMKYENGLFFYDENTIELYDFQNQEYHEYKNPLAKDYYYSGTYKTSNETFYLYDIMENILYLENLENQTIKEFDTSILTNSGPLSQYIFVNHYLYIYVLKDTDNFFVIDLDKLNLETTYIEDYTKKMINCINDLISNIKENSNVNIEIRDNAVLNFPDFSAESFTNNEETLDALNRIETILSKYDKEFFDSFYDNNFQGLNLYLTGELTPSDYETQAANPAAYSLVYQNKYMIVIDLNQPNIEELLCHELLHNLEFNLNNKKIIPFSNWNTYNPENYYYLLSYTGTNNNNYTLTESDKNNVYFIDYYSHTFPTEDRARVFERICSCEDDSIVNDYPHLYQKGLYLKEEITKYYPSLADTSLFNSLK